MTKDKMTSFARIENFILDNDFIADPFNVVVDDEGTCRTDIFGYLVMNHPDISALDLPDGIHAYPIRHCDDDDSVPCTLEKENVVVNYYGLFLTGADLDWMFGDKDYLEIRDWGYDYI